MTNKFTFIIKIFSAGALFSLLFILSISAIPGISNSKITVFTADETTNTKVADKVEAKPSPKVGDQVSGGGDTTEFRVGLQYLQLSNFDCVFPQDGCKQNLFDGLLKFLQGIAPYVAVLFIIFGGFEWINDKDVKKTTASATIFAAIGGYIVVMLAPRLVDVIRRTFDSSGQINPTAIGELLDMFIDFGLNLSTVGCVAALVIAGYSYFIEYYYNEGRQQDKVKPNDLIFGAITGLVIITLARPIIAFIKTIFIGDEAGNTIQFATAPLVTFIQNFLVRFAIPLSSIISVVFIVAAGYLWMTATGDDAQKKTAAARSMLLNAIIGIVIVLLCTTITQLIVFFIKPVNNFIPVSDQANEEINRTKPFETKTPSTGSIVDGTEDESSTKADKK
jgi:type IV secretory pathway VirB2 component (pilin)